ncbi:hypothetical protein GCM10028791_10140 [Echinicola sediminis]
MMKKGILSVLMLFHACCLLAQELEWYDPLDANKTVLEGQGWDNIGYNRLPDDAEGKVRPAVWKLSRDAAGIMLRFVTDASKIQVKFIPGEGLQMPHMPATGDSGLDLYTKDKKGRWNWIRGAFSFGDDQVSYTFFTPNNSNIAREYQLYLPLYNSVDELKIGVEESAQFDFKESRPEAPIVVYGTSIAQGACASRPGMAWTNIVGRTLDIPLINLGFSGNGKLEEELIDYIKTIDAKVFVLDCLPNLGPNSGLGEEEIKKRIKSSVVSLRASHPDTPILLVEHAGYSDGLVNAERRKIYAELNLWMESSYKELKREGLKDIHLLPHKKIGMEIDDFVDGTHPTDLGMRRYADAYVKKLKKIIK